VGERALPKSLARLRSAGIGDGVPRNFRFCHRRIIGTALTRVGNPAGTLTRQRGSRAECAGGRLWDSPRGCRAGVRRTIPRSRNRVLVHHGKVAKQCCSFCRSLHLDWPTRTSAEIKQRLAAQRRGISTPNPKRDADQLARRRSHHRRKSAPKWDGIGHVPDVPK